MIKKSLHATSAGVISGARYLGAAQKEKNALYSVRAVEDRDGTVPQEIGAVKALVQLPHYEESNQPVDDYLRNQCLRCHIWTQGAQRSGDFRAGGCSACHVLYGDDGLSHSQDPTIPDDEPGHPVQNILKNLMIRNDRRLLQGKLDGKIHNIPQIRALNERNALPVAMQIEGHMEKLECYACHAKWAPQCYGCHAKMDKRKKGFDWVDDQENLTNKMDWTFRLNWNESSMKTATRSRQQAM